MNFNFQYKIESFNQNDSRIFVLYFPENTDLPVLGEYFTINENMTPEEIDTMITNLVPVYKWIRFQENSNAKNIVENLIGRPKSELITITTSEPTPAPTKTPEEIAQELIIETENKKNEIRQKRNALLFLTDYTQVEDYSGNNKEEWRTYRQLLRDITIQENFPNSVQWPEPPTTINKLNNLNLLF